MRIGIIGAGKIGQMRVQTVQENPKTTLAAVMDLSAEKAAALAKGAPRSFPTASVFSTCQWMR